MSEASDILSAAGSTPETVEIFKDMQGGHYINFPGMNGDLIKAAVNLQSQVVGNVTYDPTPMADNPDYKSAGTTNLAGWHWVEFQASDVTQDAVAALQAMGAMAGNPRATINANNAKWYGNK